jgi:hypothetical protein
MKKIFDVRHIIIAILLLLAIVEFINPKGIMPRRTISVHDTVGIEVPVHDTVGVEVPVEVEVPVQVLVDKPVPYAVHDTILTKVDTNYIVDNYLNSKNIFTNTYKFNANQGSITIIDTISKNKIIGRKYTTKITPRIDTLRLPAIFKKELYMGIDARLDKPNYINLLGLGFMYKTKENMIYKIDLGVQNQVLEGNNGKFVPYIGGGVYWKLPIKQ